MYCQICECYIKPANVLLYLLSIFWRQLRAVKRCKQTGIADLIVAVNWVTYLLISLCFLASPFTLLSTCASIAKHTLSLLSAFVRGHSGAHSPLWSGLLCACVFACLRARCVWLMHNRSLLIDFWVNNGVGHRREWALSPFPRLRKEAVPPISSGVYRQFSARSLQAMWKWQLLASLGLLTKVMAQTEFCFCFPVLSWLRVP